MVPVCVDSKAVAAVISGWTGIPVGQMLADELHTVLHLQDNARRARRRPERTRSTPSRNACARTAPDLDDPGKPVGVFLLVGPSGVGKTETAFALADTLYGGERNMITVNMSEFQEAHTVSRLKGAPPGYVGYGRGGVLTEAVRRRPVQRRAARRNGKSPSGRAEAVLPGVRQGRDGRRRRRAVDFRNTVILATSNVGSELLLNTPAAALATDTFAKALRDVLLSAFRPAFLARMTTVPYRMLDDTMLRAIIEQKLEQLRKRYHEATGKQFAFDARSSMRCWPAAAPRALVKSTTC